MNVAELVEELSKLPQHMDVRLEVAEDEDVPLSADNIQKSVIRQQVIIAPVAMDLADIDRDKTRTMVPPKPKAAPCDTPKAKAHDGQEHLEVHSVVFCRECRRVFIPGKETRADSIMPCGHEPDVWMVGKCIVSDNEDSQFVEWMRSNGELDDALQELEVAGGHYDPSECGQGRLILPER